MSEIDRLFVCWRSPDDEKLHVVGKLWRDAKGFAFGYIDNLSEIERIGFMLMVEFPEHRTIRDPYRCPRLFSTFAQRIPSPKRPDYARMMVAWSVERPDDPFEVLAKSEGRQVTDRIELRS